MKLKQLLYTHVHRTVSCRTGEVSQTVTGTAAHMYTDSLTASASSSCMHRLQRPANRDEQLRTFSFFCPLHLTMYAAVDASDIDGSAGGL